MSTPRGPGRDLSALKKSSGLRALRPDTAEPDKPRADQPQQLAHTEPLREEKTEKAAAQVATRQQSAASEPTGAKRGTIAYLPAEVKARLEEAAAATGQTYTEWFLDQFDAFYDQLAEEFPPLRERRSPLPQRTRAPRRRVGTGPLTMVQLRLTGEERGARRAPRSTQRAVTIGVRHPDYRTWDKEADDLKDASSLASGILHPCSPRRLGCTGPEVGDSTGG